MVHSLAKVLPLSYNSSCQNQLRIHARGQNVREQENYIELKKYHISGIDAHNRDAHLVGKSRGAKTSQAV